MFLSVLYIAKTALRDGLKAISAFRTIILAFLTKPVKASVKAISRKFATFLSGTVFIRHKPVSVHRVHRTLKADRINIRQQFSRYAGFVRSFRYFRSEWVEKHNNRRVSGSTRYSKQSVLTFGGNRSAIKNQGQRRFVTLVMTIIDTLMTAKILFSVQHLGRSKQDNPSATSPEMMPVE